MLAVGVLFSSSLNPLSMGLFILLHTFIVCLYFATISSRFWFSLILFLVFLGGLIIIFIYVASLAPNKWYLHRPDGLILARGFTVAGVAGVLADRSVLGLFRKINHFYSEAVITPGAEVQVCMAFGLLGPRGTLSFTYSTRF